MCGIIGMITKEGTKHWMDRRDCIKNLLVFDTVRGWDSTGIFAVPSNPKSDIVYFKKAIMGPDFVQLPKTASILANVDNHRFFIGHNRAATKGKVNNNTAHPFLHGDIIGVHNGTLRNGRGLKNYSDFNVDSDALLWNLSEYDKDEIIPNLDGAFALVWHDTRDSSLHIVRNDERTFGFVKVKGEDTIFFGSEVPMIAAAMARNKLEIESTWEAKEGREYIFSEDDPMNFTVKDHELYEPPMRGSYGYGYGFGNYNRGGRNAALPAPNNFSNNNKRAAKRSDRQKKTEDLKKKYGLENKGKVEVHPLSFQPYGNSPIGCMQCCIRTSEDEWWDGVVHQVNVRDWEEKWEDEVAIGEIEHIREYSTNDVMLIMKYETLTLDTDDLVDEEDEEVFDNQADKPKLLGPNGTLFTQREWDSATRHGCAYCQANIFDSDDRKIVWTPDNQPICPNCAMDQEAAIH